MPPPTIENLAKATLCQDAKNLLRTNAELACNKSLHEEIAERAASAREDLTESLSREITEVTLARRAFRDYKPFASMALALGLLIAFYVSLHLSLFGSLFTLITVIISIVATVSSILYRSIHVLTKRYKLIQVARLSLKQSLNFQLSALIRKIINDLESDERNWGRLFRATQAPALVELDTDETISSRTYEEVKSFILGHSASAIGIAGPRGSGKSTLMEKLRHDSQINHISVRISAPVYYSPTEFIRLIHGRLARQALSPKLNVSRFTIPTIRHSLARFAKAIGLLVVAAGLLAAWIVDQLDLRQSATSAAEGKLVGFRLGWLTMVSVVGLSALLGIGLYRAWRTFWNRSLLTREPVTVYELAAQQLEFLRWSASVQHTSKAQLTLEGLKFEGSNQLSKTERELTHGECVDALRQFMEHLVVLTDKPILICIDELDKIADPEQSVETINGLKDLFHIPRVHFILSISNDAMHRFAARGVPVRDVFDSSFDEIIGLKRLSFDESRLLVARRAAQFSATASMFCHAWSGGHPRDLIRNARSCVNFRRERDRDVNLCEMSDAILKADVTEVLNAAIEKIHSRKLSDQASRLVTFRELISNENKLLFEVVDTLQGTSLLAIKSEASEADAVVNALDEYVRIAALISRVFSEERSPAQWRSAEVRTAVEILAGVRSSLAMPALDTQHLLDEAVAACARVCPHPPEPAMLR